MGLTRILKFNLPPVGETRVALTEGTRILAIGWQGRQLVVWTETPSAEDAPVPFVDFTVALTGDPRPTGDYVGTAQLDADGQPYVVHVYSRPVR